MRRRSISRNLSSVRVIRRRAAELLHSRVLADGGVEEARRIRDIGLEGSSISADGNRLDVGSVRTVRRGHDRSVIRD